jgi:uncharacterized protein
MPVSPTYPGVYIEEIPSGVRTITGVATSIAAFIGRALRGPTDEAVTITSFADFERDFGGTWLESSLGYAVRDFFQNGGGQAIVVRLYNAEEADDGAGGTAPLENYEFTVGGMGLVAKYPGKWGATLRAEIDREGLTDSSLFNLKISQGSGTGETYLNLSTNTASPRHLERVLASESVLVGAKSGATPSLSTVNTAKQAYETARQTFETTPNDTNRTALWTAQDALWTATLDAVSQAQRKYERAKKFREQLPTGDANLATAKTAEATAKTAFETARGNAATGVSDGTHLTINNFLPASGELNKKGLFALEQADLFNLLVIPPYLAPDQSVDVDVNLISAAAAYCERRRAMLLVESPKNWNSVTTARKEFTDTTDDKVGTRSRNAALFFPRIKRKNPDRNNQIEEFPACGAVAGVFARTDVRRGVWKAPAGLAATLVDAPQLEVPMTDAENGLLNPLGVNCLRALGPAGRVIWGSRTLAGNDQLADEYKYIPVRRLALFLEESLYRGLHWVVFEPNDEPLWGQIRMNVGAFMNGLFRQGAFQGASPRDAYSVRCDKTTTTQNDINLGIVNIVVGFAPLKPAEFVILKLQQLAGQIQT